MTNPLPGRLIALEGIDGCGKSTQAALLANRLGAVLTHEPGATDLGQALRGLLLSTSGPVLGDRTEALLMAADRAQHVEEVILPALAAGRWIVSDRFSGSTLAYQGFGRGLNLPFLRDLVSWAASGITPDLFVLVDVDLDLALERRGDDPAGKGGDRTGDRLERLGPEFHRRVRDGFLLLARADPDRWVIIDGSGSPSTVGAAIDRVVQERLGVPPNSSTRP